ncbi:hypothetical protein B0H14DRAFT_3631699 [Mycena olivaceomarginata]|nr:hypothetical protein B0H14DRAFT_3631699 [Mycena olivaceomarginata]
MVPDPNVPDWKEPTTCWYPANFIERHKRAVPHDEYKFRWFECTDGIIYDSKSSILQPSMLRWFTQSRKFCEEIAKVDLTAEQVGKVRILFYILPDYPDHQNPLLKEIFGAAIQQVAKILIDFDLSHSLVANFAEHFKSVKAAERHRRVPDWMRTIGSTPTPKLEAAISPPLTSLPGHSLLSHIPLFERQERFFYSCWLSETNFESRSTSMATFWMILTPVVLYPARVLSVIFWAIPFNEGTTAKLTSQMLKFNSAHIIYDPEFFPPTFRRKDPSIFTPTTAIPVMLNLKRKGSGKIEGEKSAKKAKDSKKSGTAPSKKKERVEQANGITTMRTLRSRTVRYQEKAP